MFVRRMPRRSWAGIVGIPRRPFRSDHIAGMGNGPDPQRVGMNEYLDQTEQARLEKLRQADGVAGETLRQLERVLASRKFARVQQKAKDFLGFVVAKALLGSAHQVKETTVAVAVYDEPADFNPAENSKVRVAAGDLRQRLADYYEVEGLGDPIVILIPLDTYVPDIRDRRATVTVSRFENWHPQGDQDHFCDSLSDDITYRLNQNRCVRARRVEALQRDGDSTQYGLRGSLECRADVLRLNVSLGHLASGRIVCSQSFEGPCDDLFKLSRDVTSVLSRTLRADVQDNLLARAKAGPSLL